MLHKVGFIAAMCTLNAVAAPQPYWVCVDAKGGKLAQDHPCEGAPAPQAPQPAMVTQPPVPAPPSVQMPKPVSAQSSPAASTRTANSGSPLWVLILFVMLIAGLVKAMSEKGHGTRRTAGRTAGANRKVPGLAPAPEPAPQPPASPPGQWSLELIRTLEWKRFEELCAGLWSALGYRAELTGDGADAGVDVHLYRPSDPEKRLALIQCKSRWTDPVGVAVVREMYGNMHHFGAPLGIVMTSSSFSDDARAFAEGKNLKLIDGPTLLARLLALPEEPSRELLQHVTRGDYLTPSCPSCGDKMLKRQSAKGAFWGCVNYPRCRRSFRFQEERMTPA